MTTHRGDRVRTLRAIGAPPDPLAFRRRVERAFERASLQSPSLPREAIVCVRRLRVSAPTDEKWSAVESALPSLIGRGIRPCSGPVPAGANVVVFLDEAELLACLTRDWSQGTGDTWWWRSLFGEAASSALIAHRFTESATAVPAAIETLSRMRVATAVIQSLPPALCEGIAAAVAVAFAVPHWAPPSLTTREHAGTLVDRVHDVRLSAHAAARFEMILADQPRAAIARLEPSQRALLGLSLALSRAPGLARLASVVARLREGEWGSAFEIPAAPDVVHGIDGPEGREESRLAAVTVDPLAQSNSHLRSDVDASDVPVSTRAPVMDEAPLPRSLIREASVDPTDASLRDVAANEPPQAASNGSRAQPAPPAAFEIEIHTQFAGLFYLVNLALYLELYSDFTQPARPGINLHVADFLALVGEHVCGPSMRADPIWVLLASLSRRDVSESPAWAFEPPDNLTVEEWLSDVIARLASSAARALGNDEASSLLFLCVRHGQVAVSENRIDVTLPLAEHPLEIRMAGLDRDPGWVPAAGRAVGFHFE